jgi:hypothetical protein
MSVLASKGVRDRARTVRAPKLTWHFGGRGVALRCPGLSASLATAFCPARECHYSPSIDLAFVHRVSGAPHVHLAGTGTPPAHPTASAALFGSAMIVTVASASRPTVTVIGLYVGAGLCIAGGAEAAISFSHHRRLCMRGTGAIDPNYSDPADCRDDGRHRIGRQPRPLSWRSGRRHCRARSPRDVGARDRVGHLLLTPMLASGLSEMPINAASVISLVDLLLIRLPSRDSADIVIASDAGHARRPVRDPG